MLRVLLTSALISHTSTYINYICLNISRVLISLTRLLITLHQYYTSKHLTRVLIINFQLANMQAIYGQRKIYLFHTVLSNSRIDICISYYVFESYPLFYGQRAAYSKIYWYMHYILYIRILIFFYGQRATYSKFTYMFTSRASLTLTVLSYNAIWPLKPKTFQANKVPLKPFHHNTLPQCYMTSDI